MRTRRDFIKTVGVGGAVIFMPFNMRGSRLMAALGGATKLDPGTLTKFVDPLPIPGAYTRMATSTATDTYYQIEMAPCTQSFHQQLPATTLWGYGDATNPGHTSYPSGTFEVVKGEKVHVRWINHLPGTLHPLPVDTNLFGSGPGIPQLRIVTHLHGGHVEAASDGYPFAWVDNTSANNYFDYNYDNNQDETTLWYHDHAISITRLNVYMGPAGFWLIRGPMETALNLPSGAYEIPIVLQDRFLNTDGSLLYPVRDPNQIPTSDLHPGPWVPEVFGDVIVVNGKAWPYLNVEPRKYRFRVLAASQARMWDLRLDDGTLTGMPFVQIGSEGGFLPTPVTMSNLFMANAERADIILDFSPYAVGQTITMTNSAPFPFPTGVNPDGNTGMVMQFKVVPLTGADTTVIPTDLRPTNPLTVLNPATAVQTRNMLLREHLDPAGNPIMMLINEEMLKMDPVSIKPVIGTTEIWRYINTTGDAHPMHMHLEMFQVLDRTPFNNAQFMADGFPVNNIENYFTGPAVGPGPNESGNKDTVRAMPAEMTRIIMNFQDYLGEYMLHCHILEHEDNSMMVGFTVVPPEDKVAGTEGQGVVLWFDPLSVRDMVHDLPVTDVTQVNLYENKGSHLVTKWATAPDAKMEPTLDPFTTPFRSVKFTESLVYGRSSVLTVPASKYVTTDWPAAKPMPDQALYLPPLGKNLFIAFKPPTISDNVPKVLFAAGGVVSGFNAYVQNGNLVMGIWNRNSRYFFEFAGGLTPDTFYMAHMELEKTATVSRVRMILNGVSSGWLDFDGLQWDDSPTGIGAGVKGTTFRNWGAFTDYSNNYDGYIGDVKLYSGIMDATIMATQYAFFTSRYGLLNVTQPIPKASAWTIHDESDKIAEEVHDNLKVYPNPIHGSAKLDLYLENKERLNIDLVDMAGFKVLDIYDGMVSKGTSTFDIHARNVPSGAYAVKITGDNFSATKKVVVKR